MSLNIQTNVAFLAAQRNLSTPLSQLDPTYNIISDAESKGYTSLDAIYAKDPDYNPKRAPATGLQAGSFSAALMASLLPGGTTSPPAQVSAACGLPLLGG